MQSCGVGLTIHAQRVCARLAAWGSRSFEINACLPALAISLYSCLPIRNIRNASAGCPAAPKSIPNPKFDDDSHSDKAPFAGLVHVSARDNRYAFSYLVSAF